MALGIPGLRSPGGSPELVGLARSLGDISSIKKFYGSDKAEEMIVNRVRNRIIGRIGGRTFSAVKGAAGLFGMVALAEFLTVLRGWVEFEASTPMWAGNAAVYASNINFGFTDLNGTTHPAQPFFSKALSDAVENKYGNKSLRNLFAPPMFVNAKGKARVRSGIYESGRFVSDWRGFWSGDIVGRAVRRETGRVAAGFFWQTLRDPRKNVLGELALETVRAARRNIRAMDLYDTGLLWSANAAGSDEDEMLSHGAEQAIEHMQREHGWGEHRTKKKLDTAANVGGVPGLYKMSTFPAGSGG